MCVVSATRCFTQRSRYQTACPPRSAARAEAARTARAEADRATLVAAAAARRDVEGLDGTAPVALLRELIGRHSTFSHISRGTGSPARRTTAAPL